MYTPKQEAERRAYVDACIEVILEELVGRQFEPDNILIQNVRKAIGQVLAGRDIVDLEAFYPGSEPPEPEPEPFVPPSINGLKRYGIDRPSVLSHDDILAMMLGYGTRSTRGYNITLQRTNPSMMIYIVPGHSIKVISGDVITVTERD